MSSQLSSYEREKLYRQQLQQAKEEELAKTEQQKGQFGEDLANEPDRLTDEAEAKKRWEEERRQAGVERIRRLASGQAKQKIAAKIPARAKLKGKVVKKGLKILSKQIILPILEALGGFLVTVGPWILAGLAILFIVALIITVKCEILNSLPGLLRSIAGWFGVKCPV